MNIEDYISTGILEAYVLGELSEQEMAEVQQNIGLYPALRAELIKVEETQEKLLIQLGVRPSEQVKSRLFEKINKNPAGKIVSLTQPSFGYWKYATAASVVFALVTSYLAFNYWNKWKASESNLTNLIAQNQRIAQDYNNVNLRLDQIESDLKVTSNPNFSRVVMRGTENAPQSLATVYWNQETQEVFLSVQNMKVLSKENQYQLWAIIDGKPVDFGVFDSGQAGLLKMKDGEKLPSAFAVTIERRGGNPTPSLETMQVLGNIVKS